MRFRAICEQSLVNCRPLESTALHGISQRYVKYASAALGDPLASERPWRWVESFPGDI